MMKNDFPLCKLLLVETINTGAKHCLNTTVSHICLFLIKKPLTPLKKFSQSSWGVYTSKPEQHTPSAFHTPHHHNSSHKIKIYNTQED
jgi:hypothetical protein